MDEAALHVSRAGVGVLLRCRKTREDAARKALVQSQHALDHAAAAERRAGEVLSGHRAAQVEREQQVLRAMFDRAVTARDLERLRQELATLAEIGESMVRAVEQARVLRTQAEAQRDQARRTLVVRARDAKKWDGILDRVARAQDDAAAEAEEGELGDELADRHAWQACRA